MIIVTAGVFALSIIGLVECELHWFPKAVDVKGVIVALLAAIVCIAVAVYAANALHEQPGSTVGWITAGLMLTVYVLTRSIVTYRRIRGGTSAAMKDTER